MKFKYSAFIENTPEMREWCIRNGIMPFLHNKSLNDLGRYIKVFGVGLRVYSCSDIAKDVDGVDCTGNPSLFQAVTVIREDSDYMQMFTDGKSWVLCKGNNFEEWYHFENTEKLYFDGKLIHKATLEELQNHFKINK